MLYWDIKALLFLILKNDSDLSSEPPFPSRSCPVLSHHFPSYHRPLTSQWPCTYWRCSLVGSEQPTVVSTWIFLLSDWRRIAADSSTTHPWCWSSAPPNLRGVYFHKHLCLNIYCVAKSFVTPEYHCNLGIKGHHSFFWPFLVPCCKVRFQKTPLLLHCLPSFLFPPHFFHLFVFLFSPSASPLPQERDRLTKLAVTWNPLNKDNTPKLTFSSLSSSLEADKPDKQNFNCLTFHIQFDDGKILKTTCIQTNTNLSLWHSPSVPLHLTFIQSFPLPFSPLLDADKPLNYRHRNYVFVFCS